MNDKNSNIDDTKVTDVYDKLVKQALEVGFTEQQFLFIVNKIVQTVSPSLVDLQEQIDDLKNKLNREK
jgi:hypothetical protein